MAINKLNHLYTLSKFLLPVIVIILSITNIKSCAKIGVLENQITAKDSTLVKQDRLIASYLKSDGTQVNKYDIENLPEISEEFLKHKIDSLKSEGVFGNDKANPSKGGFYTKSKVQLTLKDAKATFENDSLAEYKTDNWYVGFNKTSSIFNVNYDGEIEQATVFNEYKNFLGLKTKYDLNTYKWTNDSTFKVIGSQTIYYPVKEKERSFKIYANSEYRQGLNISKESATLGESSIYQGIGLGFKKNRSEFGINYNKKLLGDKFFPSDEIQVNYKFHILK